MCYYSRRDLDWNVLLCHFKAKFEYFPVATRRYPSIG